MNETPGREAPYEGDTMSTHEMHHLTADELDAILDGAGSPRAITHVTDCTMCYTLVQLDQQVVGALAGLPALDPPAGFDSRVMARVTVRAPVVHGGVVITARARDARRRVAVGALVVGSAVAGGFAWAAANPADALAWANPALSGIGQTAWTSLQAIAANATEQPWFNSARDLVTTPARALPIVAAVAGVYAAALVGLRRLLVEPAANAGW